MRCRVYPIRLNQFGIGTDTLQKKGDKRKSVFVRQLRKDILEGGGVAISIIRRQYHADQQDLRTGIGGVDNHRFQVLPDLADRIAAQAVVAAQFDDENIRLVNFQCFG